MNSQPGTQVSREDQVQVKFNSELMNNYFPESTIEAKKEIRTLMIGPDQPLLFFQNTEEKLMAVLRKEGSFTGWVSFSLSNQAVVDYELEYNPETESFQIAKVEDNQVLVSQSISIKDTNFEKLDAVINWKSVTPDSWKEQIDRVSLGREHLLFATSQPNSDALHYLVDLKDLKPKSYTLPEHATKILHFELGSFLYSNGVFFLYQIGQVKGMLYQSFPDPVYQKTDQWRFEFEESIECFALVESEEGNDRVYAAGNRVHEVSAAADGSSFSIQTLPGKFNTIKKIRAASFQLENTIWALDEIGLHYQTNRFFDQKKQAFEIGRWTSPLLMVEGAEQFSCAKGRGIRNQLYTINTSAGNELSRLWQDEVTSLWHNHTLYLEDLNALKEVESYAAQVMFQTPHTLRSFQGTSVNLSAETNLLVYINSKSYHLKPNEQVAIPLGLVPEFTIICPVKEIGSSRIKLSAPFLEEEIAIDLSNQVLARLDNRIKESGGLDKLQTKNGKPLIPGQPDHAVVKEVEKGIAQALSLNQSLAQNNLHNFQTTSFSIQHPGNQQKANTNVLSHSFLDEAGHTLGDFFHSIWMKAQQVVEFVVERVTEGVRFVIKIGEQVLNWIVKTVQEIGAFVQRVFEAIGVFFKDLFDFLAFLFDWDSIVQTKNAYKGFVNNSLESLRLEIGNIKHFIDTTLEREIAKFSPELVIIPEQMDQVKASNPSAGPGPDPRSNWLNSKKDYLNHSKESGGNKRMPDEFSTVFEDLIRRLQPILQETGVGFLHEIQLVGEEFQNVISGKISFGQFLQFALQKLAGTGLFLLKQFIDVLLETLEALLEAAYVGLNKEWQIPIISELYKKVSGGDAMSFLDVMCLLVAIPTTILYKIAENKAPFESPATKEAFLKRGETVFQLNLN
ncbi:hypothetical protein [Algoriphagus sp.]|uniref:hypothetical protein n=1 Tax=Algoriphagus sp. TaxID=1872435 RepID=UPI002601DBA1|nr:hypothetical protein [Algoriphagus sp.]